MKHTYLLAPILGWIVAQTIKFAVTLRKDGLQWGDAIQSGGMPSSHSAFIVALTTLVGINEGAASVAFAICASLSAIVIYDAMGVRHTTGQQTDAINELAKVSKHKLTSKVTVSRGHTLAEVLAGCVIGLAVGVIIHVVAR